ncbi:hypothetical protein Csa_009342 [Cucumis sativus]|nr:hypothetical protein Csa_009342 [Cucumis sativus]
MFKFSSTFLLHFIHKRSLNTISTSTLPSPSVSTIQFLTNSCGLSSGSLTSNGRKLRFDEKHIQQYEAIIGFFKSHGFENSQIANLVSRRPSILQSRVSTNLKPKFEFLQEIGFVGPLLLKLILSTPWVLGSSLVSQLKPSFFFMKEILESDEQVTAAICRSPRLLICDLKGNFKSSADVLASEGVPSRNITKMITLNPRTFMQKADRVIGAVKTVKELGIEPKARMFIYALFSTSGSNRGTKFLRHGKGKRKIGKAGGNCQQLEGELLENGLWQVPEKLHLNKMKTEHLKDDSALDALTQSSETRQSIWKQQHHGEAG